MLAVVSFVRWLQRRGATRAWLTATFWTLAAVVIAGRFLPQHPTSTVQQNLSKGLIAVLVLFPYFLFRFVNAMRRLSKRLNVLALVMTAIVSLGAFGLGRLPEQGAPLTHRLQLYLIALLIQWVFLSVIVSVQLWRGGRGQSTIARRRMRLLSIAALGLAFTLVLSGTSGNNGQQHITVLSLLIQSLGLLTAPLFLLGAAPPRWLLASWRRPELAELQLAQRGLMTAVTPGEVLDILLPHAAHLIGGHASLLVLDDKVSGTFGLSDEEAFAIAAEGKGARADVVTVPVEHGWLGVLATPFTPYFGRDESDLLVSLATFTDLALGRTASLERERANAEALKQANEALVASNEAVREFVAIASHDLRTPITVIQGFAATMDEQWDNLTEAERRHFLATIDRQSQHLARMVNDLLTVSQIDAKALQPRVEDVDVEDVVDRALDGLGERRQQVRLDVPNDLRVRADPEHVVRILANYITNAFNYGEPPVDVEARAAGGGIEIRVRDHGEGVPREFVPRLFEKFARADRKLSKASQGTGLGLSIVRGLARAVGGDAWYEDNGGSCFAVRLPSAGSTGARKVTL